MRGRIKLAWLAAVVGISLLAFRVESLVAIAQYNVVAVDFLPQIVMGLDGLGWPCTAMAEQPRNDRPFASYALQGPNRGLLMGQLAAVQGDCATALREWQLAADNNDPDSRLAHFELGRGLYSLGDLPGAIEQFRLSDAGQHIHNLALSRRQANQAAEAQTLFELAFAVKPNVLTADQLAQIYAEAGQDERVVNVWQQLADSTNSQEVDHWLALAEAATLRLDWAQTGAALEQALKLTDDPYLIYLRLGRTKMKQADWAGAVGAYERAAELKPAASSEPYSQAGIASAQFGNYREAMEWFDRGVRSTPRDPWPEIHAGILAEQLGDVIEAEQRLRAAVAIAPDHYGAIHALGAFLIRQGRAGESVPYLERIVVSSDCTVLTMLSEGYTASGDLQRAELMREQATQACH